MKFCDGCVFFLASMMENQTKNIQVVLTMKILAEIKVIRTKKLGSKTEYNCKIAHPLFFFFFFLMMVMHVCVWGGGGGEEGG